MNNDQQQILFNQNYRCAKCYYRKFNFYFFNYRAICIDCYYLQQNKMEVETNERFTCFCAPGFVWRNKKNYKKHLYSRRHIESAKMEID